MFSEQLSKKFDKMVTNYPTKRSALVPMLLFAQDEVGHLSDAVIADIAATDAAGMRFSIATDVGGGTSFSMLRTLGEAYKVSQMLGQHLTPLRAFYLATLGGARCLQLDDRIGNFTVGHEADFVVLDRHATPLLARRCAQATSLSETLLILMTLGDDRVIAATYAMGEEIHRRISVAPGGEL